MKYDDIKKAANELCTTEKQEEWLKDYGIHCFLDGSRWRIENAWHDTTQLPHDGLLLCQDGYSVFIGGPDNQDFARAVEAFHITRWAYIDDLLPDRKEAKQ